MYGSRRGSHICADPTFQTKKKKRENDQKPDTRSKFSDAGPGLSVSCLQQQQRSGIGRPLQNKLRRYSSDLHIPAFATLPGPIHRPLPVRRQIFDMQMQLLIHVCSIHFSLKEWIHTSLGAHI